MKLQAIIRFLKTSPVMVPVLAAVDFVLWIIDRLAVLSVGSVSTRPNTLVVLKFDVMGDYVLFRNYLRYLKQQLPYANNAITLCGNPAFRTIAETFDQDIVDQFIWVDIYKLTTRPLYRFKFVRQLRQQGFSIAFCPTHSRVLVLDDFMAKVTGAPVRVGCQGDRINIKPWEARYGDSCYTRLLPSQPGILFESERNRQTLEAFLQQPVPTQQPRLPTANLSAVSLPKPYVVLSLGAGQPFRVWPAVRFAEVVNYLQRNYPDHRIVLTGAPGEELFANALLAQLTNFDGIENLTARLSLLQLIALLAEAELLIANETGTVHLAAAVGTPTVVISQGKSLVRWHPYPATTAKEIQYLYPPELEQHRADLSAVAERFNPESPLSIDEVSAERVINQLNSALQRRSRFVG
jgi:ADP-heptose:LPS heptosyltransferase